MTEHADCGTCRVIPVSDNEVEIAVDSECIVHMPRVAFTLDEGDR